MGDLRDLYQELILDHGKNPRNKRKIDDCPGASCQCAEGANPLCGDRLVLYVKTADGKVDDLAFDGAGCAIFTASSSILTETLRGKSLAEAREIMRRFFVMLTEDAETDPESLGKLAVFAGVKDFPIRVKCATLAWRTLEAALEGRDEMVTSE